MTNRDEILAALDGNAAKPKRKPSGDPGGPKRCTDACIKVEAREAVGCICEWRCWKENQYSKTKHIRFELDWRCPSDMGIPGSAAYRAELLARDAALGRPYHRDKATAPVAGKERQQ